MAQWDVSTAVYLQEFSVAVRDNSPQDVFIKPDGTKMYVIGSQNDKVYEYDLGVQWDVTSAVYLQEFSIAAKEIYPAGLWLKPDGTKMYIVGTENDEVNEYDLGVQWDVTSAVWLQAISVFAKEADPKGIYFKPDGTKMYTVGRAGKSVDEYDLGVQWDISTAVYADEGSVWAHDAEPQSVYLKPDGTKMYVVGDDGNTVDEYDFGVPWDIETAVWLQEFSVAAKETAPTGAFLKPDGTKMYVVGSDGDTVDEYDL